MKRRLALAAVLIEVAAYILWAWRDRPQPGRRLVVWDDGCGFCARCIEVLERLDARGTFETVGSSDPRAYAGTGITPQATAEAVQLVEPDGTVLAGYDAVVRAIALLPRGWLIAPALGLPGVRDVGHRAYRNVAARRTCMVPPAATSSNRSGSPLP